MIYISDHYSYSVFIDHSAELIGTLSILMHLSQNLNWCDIDIYSPFSGFKWEYLQHLQFASTRNLIINWQLGLLIKTEFAQIFESDGIYIPVAEHVYFMRTCKYKSI